MLRRSRIYIYVFNMYLIFVIIVFIHLRGILSGSSSVLVSKKGFNSI